MNITRKTRTIGSSDITFETGKLARQAGGAVGVALIGGEWHVNPTYLDLDLAIFDMVVAGRMNDRGEVDILMVEGEAPEGTWERVRDGQPAPTEDVVADGLEAAKRAIAETIAL